MVDGWTKTDKNIEVPQKGLQRFDYLFEGYPCPLKPCSLPLFKPNKSIYKGTSVFGVYTEGSIEKDIFIADLLMRRNSNSLSKISNKKRKKIDLNG